MALSFLIFQLNVEGQLFEHRLAEVVKKPFSSE